MIGQDITHTGIMFDALTRADDPNTFPTVGELEDRYAFDASLVDTVKFRDWLVIAGNPHVMRYGDDSWEAMDETNWDAILSDLAAGADTVRVFSQHAGHLQWVNANEDDAFRAGVAEIGNMLCIVNPDSDFDDDEDREAADDRFQTAIELRSALSDYPMLDEEAYSEREFEAWCAYVPDALSDEMRDSELDDETRDALTADVALAASADLHHYDGFGGGYAPSLLAIVGRQLAWLVGNAFGTREKDYTVEMPYPT